MSARTVHVVGAGLGGLSAAVRLVEAGDRVVLYEGAKAAGGRCRSYHDATLDLTIDNGNHLLLSGNRSALDFVDLVGGGAALTESTDASFPFADLSTGERWTVRPNAGRLPWWVLVPGRRVPRTRACDYLSPVGILRAAPGTPIGQAMTCSGTLYDRLWNPVLLAALNTEVPASDAGLAAPILRETLGAGGQACRPVVATGGLSAAFVEPALTYLAARGVETRFGARLRSLGVADGVVERLAFGDAEVALDPADAVVLAVPPWIAAGVMPGICAPDEFRGILNAHFRIVPPAGTPLVLGLVGGLSEWLFAYPDRLSVTISAADRLFDTSRESLAAEIWREVSAVTGLAGLAMPTWQVVKERRATFAATPEQALKRSGPSSVYDNLVVAGDWTATGLPSTIEGAIRSGTNASSLLHLRNGEKPRGVSKACG